MHSRVLGNLLIPFVALWNSVFTFRKVSMFSCWIMEYSVPGVIPNACSVLSKEGGGCEEQLLIIPAVLMTLNQ